MRTQRANGRAPFQISAELPDGSSFEFDAVEASPALTADTVVKGGEDGSTSVGEGVLDTLLVGNSDTFVLLAIDGEDNVHGIVDPKEGKPLKIKQEKGKKVKAEEGKYILSLAWHI